MIMKLNKIQKNLCDIIQYQISCWKHSNDITSPTHSSDIWEECSKLDSLIKDEDITELESILRNLYLFIRKYDLNNN